MPALVVLQVPENHSFYTHIRDIYSRSPGSVAESLVWEMPSCKGMSRASRIVCSQMITSENMQQSRLLSPTQKAPNCREVGSRDREEKDLH